MLALCLVAGCKGKKQVYTEADVKEKDVLAPGTDVDWIELYLRAHELDSVKKVAEVAAAKLGQPMEALPDSIPQIWDAILNEVLLRHGNIAFDGIFDYHRADIARYLRLDFINYGFITKVYLPYKATVSTKEEYGEICIRELEREMEKAQMSIMLGQQVPSHYEHLLYDLFYAYINYDQDDKALQMSEEVLQYLSANTGEDSREYANMLTNKANLCHKTGNAYSALITAKRALGIYEKLLSEPSQDEATRQKMIEDRDKLQEKLKLWQEQ